MIARMALLLLFACLGVALTSAQEDSNSITLSTFNIRYANENDGEDNWAQRSKAVAEFAAQNDIIGMQEVTKSQLQELRLRLNEMDWYGVGRDDGKSGGEHAVIFVRRSRFEILDKGTFWLSEQPDVAGTMGWDAALPRTCSWVVLRDRKTNRKLWVANTHFDHRGSKARAESGKLLASVVADQADKLPVVVMGDLNCLPDSAPYRALAEVATDARTISKQPPEGPKSTWNGFDEIAPNRIIDHIFVDGPIEIERLATLDPKTEAGRFASDHLPVQIEFRLRDASADSGESE